MFPNSFEARVFLHVGCGEAAAAGDLHQELHVLLEDLGVPLRLGEGDLLGGSDVGGVEEPPHDHLHGGLLPPLVTGLQLVVHRHAQHACSNQVQLDNYFVWNYENSFILMDEKAKKNILVWKHNFRYQTVI